MTSHYGALKVRAKTREVAGYHRSPEQPGKPLHLLVPGGLVALAAFAVMVWVAWLTWYEESIGRAEGLAWLALLAPVYAGAVFLFSYGYELYDVPRALRLAMILVFVGAAAVIIAAVLFALLAKEGDALSVDSIDLDFSGAESADPSRKKKEPPRPPGG